MKMTLAVTMTAARSFFVSLLVKLAVTESSWDRVALSPAFGSRPLNRLMSLTSTCQMLVASLFSHDPTFARSDEVPKTVAMSAMKEA
jgi:hypothetical protein